MIIASGVSKKSGKFRKRVRELTVTLADGTAFVLSDTPYFKKGLDVRSASSNPSGFLTFNPMYQGVCVVQHRTCQEIEAENKPRREE